MELRTFNEWSRMGYKIKKGSKNKGKTEAGYLFSRDQVVYSPRQPYRGWSGYNDSYDEYEDAYAFDAYNMIWGLD